jgi:hypothetical protein
LYPDFTPEEIEEWTARRLEREQREASRPDPLLAAADTPTLAGYSVDQMPREGEMVAEWRLRVAR